MSVDSRRRAVLALLAAAAAPLARAQGAAAAVEVYKSPTCGCCKDWIEHLRAHGFHVKAVDVPAPGVWRARFGLPERYGSCHTALIAGYVIEGHVPAREVKRLLAERPDAIGLAVPGMPIGSPGMDGPDYGGRFDPYDVLLVRRDGSSAVFASYRGGKPNAGARQ
ncbi:MAG TPA: DUF411 domain-containing protein [Burkholderiaceae bacterium]|jgi:hypothetical protein|nr:DUF411 domain-containing protein [Burkholderiaceae bacterium]